MFSSNETPRCHIKWRLPPTLSRKVRASAG